MKMEMLFKDVSKKQGLRILMVCVFLSVIALFSFADNPIATHVYLADPSGFVANDRMYVICTHDQAGATDYSRLVDYYLFSSADLVNWQDHGIVFDARRDTSWANLAYAPDMAVVNGKYYLYFPDGGDSIGVAVADSPEGPFRDPIGRSLVNKSMPNCNVQWCFDPGIFVDDDGQAYLYFGGGGPGNARVIRLNSDMISTNGNAVTIDAPNFFEASYMHKRNGIYYFSYSTQSMTIDYMTSSNPMSGFQHRGTVLPNPWSNLNNNNHHSILEYAGQWYIFYHNRSVSNSVYQRSVCIDYLYYNSDGTMQRVNASREGVDPVDIGTPTPIPTQGPTPIPGTSYIACGSSSAVGNFQADQYFSGGSTYNNSNTVDVSGITTDTPPAALFNNERYGAMSYTIPGFTSGNSYIVTLYFAETYLTSAGSRLFNVSINGQTVLSSFDIYATAGGQNKAIAQTFTTTANSSGQIVIQFISGTENPKINGIGIKPGEGPTNSPTTPPTTPPTSPPTTPPTPPPTGDCNVSFDPANSTQALDSTFRINVVVDSGNQKLAAYGFNITYDPAILSVVDVEEGADGFLAAANTATPGEIMASGFDSSGTGPGSDLQVLIITFNGIAEGTSTLGLYVDQLVDGVPNPVGDACGVDGSVEVTPDTGLLGDADGDGDIDIVDALVIAQYYVDLDPSPFLPENADVDCDGEIDIVDALLVAQYYVDLISSFC